jgi:lysylphosphatidylglycerol synthetase-like protein (DUF2156 family)
MIVADTTHDELLRWADHPSALLALNEGTRRFRAPGLEGLVAYQEAGGWSFTLGGPFGPDRAALLDAFRASARARGRRVCGLQVREADLPLWRAAGFRLNALGTSFALDLSTFSLRGQAFMQLRNKVQRARKAGVEVVEAGVDVPRDAALWAELEAVTRAWLTSKGARLMAFMVGELGRPEDAWRRVFVARHAGQVVGFVTHVPAPGARPGVLHDLSRRRPDGPPGVMELLNVTAIERLRAEGTAWLHFGLTPLVGLEGESTEAGGSAWVSALLGWLGSRGDALYPARSQAAFKRKWGTQVEELEYFAYEGRYRLSSMYRLLQVTRSI